MNGARFRRYSMIAMIICFFGAGIVALVLEGVRNESWISFVALAIVLVLGGVLAYGIRNQIQERKQ